MSFEEETKLLQTWTANAVEGAVLVAKQLREVVENKVSHRVSDDYLWDMLHRHGWTKKSPRPEHSKATQSKEAREVFKKKHLNDSIQLLRSSRQSP